MGHRVHSTSAEDLVRASGPAVENVVDVVAVDIVVEARADRVLDRRQGVGVETVGRDLAGEVDQYPPRRGRVRRGVGSNAAEDLVRALDAAVEDVVGVVAVDVVVEG
jgi:hypothetical protein